MIKIKQVYINNFKGISNSLTIDFDNNNQLVNVLSGPNGFGKTTIFDAIDICITGQLYRFSEKQIFDGIQKNTIGRNKPYYQNKDGFDVILKLLLQDEQNETEYVIIKHYNDALGKDKVNANRANIPHDSNQFFETYLSNNKSDFKSNDYEKFGEAKKVTQKAIDQIFINNDSKVELSSVYYLFNYLQQEDNIYFLRRDEDTKGEELSFLFNIVKEKEEKEKIERVLTHLDTQHQSISDTINELEKSIVSTDNVNYEELFEGKGFKFDNEQPFSDVEDKKIANEQYSEELNTLIEFRGEFITSEYFKSKEFNFIKNKILDKEDVIESLLLKNIYNEDLVSKINERNKNIQLLKEFLDRKDRLGIDRRLFDLLFQEASDDQYKKYEFDSKALIDIDRELGVIGKIISDLLSHRMKAKEEFEKLIETNSIDDNHCPLCNTPFKIHKDLIEAIAEKSKELEFFNKSKLELKKEIVEKLDEHIKKLKLLSEKYLDKNKPFDSYIESRIKQFPNYSSFIEELIEKYPKLNSKEIDNSYFSEIPLKEKDLKDRTVLYKSNVLEKIQNDYKYDELLIQNSEMFHRYFDENVELFKACTKEKLTNKKKYIHIQYSISINKRLEFLKERKQILSKIVPKVRSLNEKVHLTIQGYKKEMIEKIKVPFYIYSGKILQSYQQGLGIFIDIRETPSKKNKVVFKTGGKSDHDIVYHLSSGQMAVVSIAFCLALNKVYNTNKNFKFLAIDDPIQTMDDLNVHTFIELLRHEFKEYQIIMSTHDDFTSKYIKYKFDKVGYKTDIKNIQQEVMEELNK